MEAELEVSNRYRTDRCAGRHMPVLLARLRLAQAPPLAARRRVRMDRCRHAPSPPAPPPAPPLILGSAAGGSVGGMTNNCRVYRSLRSGLCPFSATLSTTGIPWPRIELKEFRCLIAALKFFAETSTSHGLDCGNA